MGPSRSRRLPPAHHFQRRAALLGLALSSTGCLQALPPTGETRASGQSKLLERTFAGKHACSAESHLRPFIIEWDATDRASFESHAADDIVIVRYTGCDLQVLDECRNDSIRGSLGSYRPVSWTTGALEKIDIADEGQLFAQLPLGANSLSGKVRAGEKLHMEYYVAGTRNATRSSVYRRDLEKLPGCKGATHFVYAYNLGAFALGSVSNFEAKAGFSVYGFGIGGDRTAQAKAEKQGGELAACKGDSAKEVQGCKSPIRLALRKLREGENPEKSEVRAPETDASLNAAGRLESEMKASNNAFAHLAAAQAKFNAKDGQGCLSELDAHDKLNPNAKTTEPKSATSIVRSLCLMLAGKCRAGKGLARRAREATSINLTPEQIDAAVSGQLSTFCEGSDLEPADLLRRAFFRLRESERLKLKEAACKEEYQVVRRWFGKVPPRDRYDTDVAHGDGLLPRLIAECLSRANACSEARRLYVESYPPSLDTNLQRINTSFGHIDAVKRHCGDKP